MDWKAHGYTMGPHSEWFEDVPADEADLAAMTKRARKGIEPWLSALFQSDHLNLLLGSGFTIAASYMSGATATGMGAAKFGTKYDDRIDEYAKASAMTMGRGNANIEDQFRAALTLVDAFQILGTGKDADEAALQDALEQQMTEFLSSLLATESGIRSGSTPAKSRLALEVVQLFLLSFASRATSRERLHVFTLNYDRLIEHACDLAGLRVVDRFVGALDPVLRSTRTEIDVHYNPPGIRGEPRFVEGVVRLTKLHGSLDWHYDATSQRIHRRGISFGNKSDSSVPAKPIDTVMIYPNPAKDVETTFYPYADLFRDFAAALCRPNSVVITYGYGFGDDHVNRVLIDMLSIPSTHIVIMAHSLDERVTNFCKKASRAAQISAVVGSHLSDLQNLVMHYLPKPALDSITGRMSELLVKRMPAESALGEGGFAARGGAV